ncbi:MAG: primosomal protein N' [Betaproteobacteria bacterium]|jgi:primosomal protein N' (replication factor Y)
MAIARVALDCPVNSLFDYRTAGPAPQVGQLVVVPFGRRRQVGLVLEFVDHSALADSRLRDIERILPVEPLPGATLDLIRFSSEYYQYPIGQAAFVALPAALRRVRYAGPKPRWQYVLTDKGRDLHPDQFPARATVKRRLLEALHSAPALGHDSVLTVSANAMKLVESWVEAGWVAKHAEPYPDGKGEFTTNAQHDLTDQQRAAVDAVRAGFGSYSPWLLEGITGSGKTEVYFRLIEQAASAGMQTLLMVPEINLTPQLEERFRGRFPDLQLVSLHSNLAEGERCANWLAARAGHAQVVIGTRLSIFTPLPQLGLIIVDEEQDASFKQQDGLRYSARDLAIFCAHQRRVPILLGSATPSLETYHNAQNKRFGHLHLSRRPAAARATIRLVDIRGMAKAQSMSDQVLQAIGAGHTRGEQSLIFLNRRGFAPVLICAACGWNAGCSRCSARLVWHLRAAALRCHYCGHQERLPLACPSCGNQDLKGLGQGTQRLEQSLGEHFPDARILRIDRDSTRRKSAWHVMQDDIRRERVDILVGTQMLAKGHDFPKLTLVVVVNPDGALFSADFRAGERLFQQLMQVAGRAGRANLPGEVLVQTQFPDHPLYQALVRQDYRSFAEELLDERRRAVFPPFVYQALLRAESQSEPALMDFLGYASSNAGPAHGAVTLYDPVPATVSKIAGHHRGHLLAQCASRTELQRFLSAWRSSLVQRKVTRVRWSIDVDPIEL